MERNAYSMAAVSVEVSVGLIVGHVQTLSKFLGELYLCTTLLFCDNCCAVLFVYQVVLFMCEQACWNQLKVQRVDCKTWY